MTHHRKETCSCGRTEWVYFGCLNILPRAHTHTQNIITQYTSENHRREHHKNLSHHRTSQRSHTSENLRREHHKDLPHQRTTSENITKTSHIREHHKDLTHQRTAEQK